MSELQIFIKGVIERINNIGRKNLYKTALAAAAFLIIGVLLSSSSGFLDRFLKFYRNGAIYFFLIVVFGTIFIRIKAFKNGLPARSDWFYAALIAAAAFALYAFHASIYGMPVPGPQDDNSYILLGQTFAAGRITNPVHPMRDFFDYFHVINYPTFTSKYPPAQGLAIAIGIILGGSPIVGVWLSGAAAAATTFWMLRARFSRKWALIGAFIAVTHPGLFFWSLGFYYGFVALIGINLCLGALFRTIHRQKISYGLIFGLGIAILANSRPWEGLVACLPLAAFFFALVLRKRKNRKFLKNAALKFALPAAAILVLNAGWMAFYNYKVTGDAFTLPYQVYNKQYDSIPLFLPVFSPSKADDETGNRLKKDHLTTRNINNPAIKEFYLHEFDKFYLPLVKLRFSSYPKIFVYLIVSAYGNILDFLQAASLIYLMILVFGLWLFSNKKFFLFCTGAFLFCFLIESAATYNQNHYYAPFIGYFIFAAAAVLFQTSRINLKAREMVTAFAVVLIFAQIAVPFIDSDFTQKSKVQRSWQGQWILEEKLLKQPDKLLILVDYSSAEFGSEERFDFMTNRTYLNEPDIDRSKIVWAMSLGEEKNKELFDYFSGREVWILGFGKGVKEIDRNITPKLISCSGVKSDFPPEQELETYLRRLCPQ